MEYNAECLKIYMKKTLHRTDLIGYLGQTYGSHMGLGSAVDVALASEAEGCGFDTPTGCQVPTTACGSPN